jgi:hypothetical protein
MYKNLAILKDYLNSFQNFAIFSFQKIIELVIEIFTPKKEKRRRRRKRGQYNDLK